MTEAQKKAMQHSNALGAGAKKRKKLHGQAKVEVVMKEFGRGTLHSGSGEIVKSRKQAIAIAMSEAGMSRGKKKKKKKKGGSYSSSAVSEARSMRKA